MTGIVDTWLLFRRQVRTTLRFPTTVLLSCFQPVIWMVLFGPLFQSVATVDGFRGGTYYEFLAPGIAVMAALFASSYAGLGTLVDIQSGTLDKFLASPVSRAAIIAGPVIASAVQSTFQACVILLTALVMGARPATITGVGGVFLAVWLVAITFASLSHSVALRARTQRHLIAAINYISMPLVFLSSTMMARELMPDWMLVMAALNPIDWAVRVSRAGFSLSFGAESARAVVLLAAVSACAWAVAIRSLKGYQSDR